MLTFEQETRYQIPTVDRVGSMGYEQLLAEVYMVAEQTELSPDMVDTTFGLLDELKKHDKDTAEGGLRASPIALEIADEIENFYKIDIDKRWVLVTSLLHDVGKLAISKDLLEKSGFGQEWTEADCLAMRQHVFAGGTIMRNYGMPAAVTRAVEEHHSKQLGSNSYGVNQSLDYEARLYRDVTALADYEEADLNRTNTRNAHLSRIEREEEVATDVDYVLNDYSHSVELSRRIVTRTLGASAANRQLQLAV